MPSIFVKEHGPGERLQSTRPLRRCELDHTEALVWSTTGTCRKGRNPSFKKEYLAQGARWRAAWRAWRLGEVPPSGCQRSVWPFDDGVAAALSWAW